MTHSYTIRPTISSDGKLLSPSLLYSKKGKSIRTHSKNKLFHAPNIHTECSISGKMTKELVYTWFNSVFCQNVTG